MVVDYGRGNIFGLSRALENLDIPYAVSQSPEDVAGASRIILPGVGAFADTMTELRRRGLIQPIIEAARQGTPMLGICVGFQVMFDVGEEFGEQRGLGLLPGRVVRMPEGNGKFGWRVPNVGWRPLNVKRPNAIIPPIPPTDMVYFVHSYSASVLDSDNVIATMSFGGAEIVAAIQQKQLFGVQFHPERSGLVGLDMLRRFCTNADVRLVHV